MGPIERKYACPNFCQSGLHATFNVFVGWLDWMFKATLTE